ncbi:hypothetical protein [Nocardioides campestrisoli]|nr:hypothetical protein [Nocardioides campestrisoli]
MKHLDPVRLLVRIQTRLATRATEERGDVPGWVLITVMTAGLVGGLLKIAGPELGEILKKALNSVTGPAA